MDEAERQKQKLKFKLRKLVRDLGKRKARHTELISVYIPQGYDSQLIINQLSTEAGTARNIKSAQTRKNVTGALEKMVQHLRLYKRTPENGLALFCGNVSEREGQQDFQVWSIEPPEPIRVKLYQCDQQFFLGPLEEQLEIKSVYGLIVMDRREADIALLKGKHIEPVVHYNSMVPGKFKVGGQSAARMARVIEGMAKDFYKKVGNAVNETFSKVKVDGLLVGGPGPTKEDLVDGDFIWTDIKKKILAVKAIGYTGDFGLKELVEKSEDVLEKEEATKEKRILDTFLMYLGTRKNMVAYGEDAVRKAADMNAIAILLLHEDLPEEKIEELMDKVELAGGDVYIISRDVGEQLKGLGMIGAILRYAAA
ncbi:MAG: peptide chain release factor 1 [DPANN group archaeon]|nr:peptide chain release factor 1 [DPANN group archaeon]